MSRELTDELLSVEIFSLCMEPMTIEEVCNKIYKNMYSKNLVRCYQAITIMMKRGILIPKFLNKQIYFQVDEKIRGGNNDEQKRNK